MSKRKLLLADDSVTIQKVVNLTFAEEGIDVITVGDGDSAMEIFAEAAPDIVLADVNMPGLTGYQICEKIRAGEFSTKNIPVVLLVGSFEPFDENEAQRVGANVHLTKPFQSIRHLVTTVSELIGSDSGTPETDDIDFLYKKSFSDTLEMPRDDTASAELGDAGMDDDIIETSYADVSPADDIKKWELDEEPLVRIDEEPLIRISDEMPFDEKVEADTAAYRDEISDTETFPQNYSEETSNEETMPEFASSEDVSQEAARLIEEDESLSREEITGEDSFDMNARVEIEAPIEETVEDSKIWMEDLHEPAAEKPEPSFEFDEMNLLELPTPESGKSFEMTTPEEAVSTGNKTQVVSLSPELIEMVARIVVEKISDQITKEVARQTVPHITESIVRHTLEEETKT